MFSVKEGLVSLWIQPVSRVPYKSCNCIGCVLLKFSRTMDEVYLDRCDKHKSCYRPFAPLYAHNVS